MSRSRVYVWVCGPVEERDRERERRKLWPFHYSLTPHTPNATAQTNQKNSAVSYLDVPTDVDGIPPLAPTHHRQYTYTPTHPTPEGRKTITCKPYIFLKKDPKKNQQPKIITSMFRPTSTAYPLCARACVRSKASGSGPRREGWSVGGGRWCARE